MSANHDSSEDVSRRTLLERVALAGGAITVGTVTFSGTAAAHFCPRAPGFWATHEWPDGMADPFEMIDGDVRSHAEWRSFLRESSGGDRGHLLMKELVAASVNWQLRPTTDTGCIDEPIVDLVRDSEEESIRDVLVLAKEWAKESNFPAGQSDWQVDAATYPHGGILKRYLAGFNHARLGLECDCDGAEQEWETVDDERDGGTTNSRVGPGGRISPGVR